MFILNKIILEKINKNDHYRIDELTKCTFA